MLSKKKFCRSHLILPGCINAVPPPDFGASKYVNNVAIRFPSIAGNCPTSAEVAWSK